MTETGGPPPTGPPGPQPPPVTPAAATPPSYPPQPAPQYVPQPAPVYAPQPSPDTRPMAPPVYEPAVRGVQAAAGVARWTFLKVFSIVLPLLLIVAGAYAVLRAGGLLFRFGSRFRFFPGGIHFFLPQQRLAAFVLGVAALAVGLAFTFTIARFLRVLPPARRVIVGVQTLLLIALVIVLLSTNLI